MREARRFNICMQNIDVGVMMQWSMWKICTVLRQVLCLEYRRGLLDDVWSDYVNKKMEVDLHMYMHVQWFMMYNTPSIDLSLLPYKVTLVLDLHIWMFCCFTVSMKCWIFWYCLQTMFMEWKVVSRDSDEIQTHLSYWKLVVLTYRINKLIHKSSLNIVFSLESHHIILVHEHIVHVKIISAFIMKLWIDKLLCAIVLNVIHFTSLTFCPYFH